MPRESTTREGQNEGHETAESSRKREEGQTRESEREHQGRADEQSEQRESETNEQSSGRGGGEAGRGGSPRSPDGDELHWVGAWKAAPAALPPEWPEREHASGQELEQRRAEALRFASRRRLEPEARQVLACEPLPEEDGNQRVPKGPAREPVPMPAGAPPGKINIHQLWLDVEPVGARWRSQDQLDVEEWFRQGGAAVRYLERKAALRRELKRLAEAEAKEAPGLRKARLRVQGQAVRKQLKELARVEPPATKTYGQERLQPWARGVVWRTLDPDDCVPEQPSTAQDPPGCEVNRAFFIEWAERLGWRDEDMLDQIASGVDSRADCELVMVLRFHHQGLQRNIEPAAESIDADAQPDRGWITEGTPHQPYTPCRCIARNVAERRLWKRQSDGSLAKIVKWRVTTDDSMEEHGEGRNSNLPRDEWGDMDLPEVMRLARAAAILAAWMGEEAAWRLVGELLEAGVQSEHVVLWAIDLSDAYRKLAVQRMERWLQCLVWRDGARCDLRAVFGTASMVQFFQRVSNLLRAVIRVRHEEYDAQHPYSAARQAWMARRGGGSPSFRMNYIDDLSGACVHAADEPVRRRTAADGSVADAAAEETRAEAYVRIATDTCQEAGWECKLAKRQLGTAIEQLGFQVETQHGGRIACTADKRDGMELELSEFASATGKTPAADVESIAGKLIHLATIAVEGRAYMEPWYAMLNATRTVIMQGARTRVKLGELQLRGAGPVQQRFQQSVQWWRTAMWSDISLPLAAKLAFPDAAESGCVVAFQDAARGAGTGFGGFVPVVSADGARKLLLVCEAAWPVDLQQKLMANELSMAAGELFAYVALATAAYARLGASHVIGFTDNDPTQAAINHCCSGSPQMQALLLWFYQMCPTLQSLAIWLPGKRNTRSDALSRSQQGAEAVRREAEAAGWRVMDVPPPPGAWEILRAVAAIPHSA